MLRRIKMPDDQHEAYWRFASETLANLAADLAGPNVVYHHSKLNFKWFDETDRVKWHQDIQFFPHTNYNVFTIGCYLADTDMNNGPLAVLPGSHNEPLFDQYDADGNWIGMLSDDDAATLDMDQVNYLTGPAGTLTIHNCRTLHFSPPSKSPAPRPLLLNCFASADAKPYTPHPDPSSHATDTYLWRARPLGRPRSPTLSDPARLVRRLHLHLRGSGGRGCHVGVHLARAASGKVSVRHPVNFTDPLVDALGHG